MSWTCKIILRGIFVVLSPCLAPVHCYCYIALPPDMIWDKIKQDMIKVETGFQKQLMIPWLKTQHIEDYNPRTSRLDLRQRNHPDNEETRRNVGGNLSRRSCLPAFSLFNWCLLDCWWSIFSPKGFGERENYLESSSKANFPLVFVCLRECRIGSLWFQILCYLEADLRNDLMVSWMDESRYQCWYPRRLSRLDLLSGT